MKRTIRSLLLISIFLFALSHICFRFGSDYDEKYKLYPETIQLSYDLFIGNIYGERWRRLSDTLILFGLFLDVVALVIWYRGKQSEDKSILDLTKE